MLISVEKRFVFVANTKAASTSIEHLLLPYSDIARLGSPQRKHISMKQTLKSYPFLFDQPRFQPDSFFRFGVMRHPLDWISSWYRYRKGNKVDDPLAQDLDFSAFWAQKDWNIVRGDGTKHLQSQMFCSPNGELLMDVIIPYHQLDETLSLICDKFKIQRALTHENSSLISDPDTVPESLKDEMSEFYAKDFDLFDRLDQINAVRMEKLRRMR